jgi:translation elongation factor EF-Ts
VTEEETHSPEFRKKVYSLRLETCCSIGECRFALAVNNGDMAKAVEYMRRSTYAASHGIMDRDRYR